MIGRAEAPRPKEILNRVQDEGGAGAQRSEATREERKERDGEERNVGI